MEGQEVVTAKKKRAKYEVIIIVLVIIAAVLVAMGISRAQSKAKDGKVMIAELSQMRAAITTYLALNKTNPPDLASLTKLKYSFAPGEAERAYLANIKVGKAGELVDPFGSPYKYDAKTGRVVSMTKGYANW